MTYRDFIRALMHLGVVIETNKHGSGHVILRHGQRSAAIVSGARKVSDGWQPRDIKNILRRLEIPEERFLTAITNAGLRVAKEYEGSPNAVEVCDE
jgi:predicted RNA binding protein YcfA (HicA-like mRNA interferase family)